MLHWDIIVKLLSLIISTKMVHKRVTLKIKF